MRRIPVVVAVVTLFALLTGCVAGTGGDSQPQSVPDATTPASHFLAAPAPTPSGTITQQAAALAKQASGTGGPAQAALRRAMMMSGVDLADDTTVVDHGATPKLGVVIPEGELQFMSGQNTYEHSETVNEIAQEMSLMVLKGKKPTLEQLRTNILDGMRSMEPPSAGSSGLPATAEFYAAFFADLGRDASPSWSLDDSGIDDVRFTSLQVWLLWVGVAGGFMRTAATLHEGKSAPGVDAGSIEEMGPDVVHAGASSPCSVSDGQGHGLDWAAIGAGVATGGIGFIEFGGLIGTMFPDSENPGTTQGVGDAVGWANAALSLAHLVADSMAFNATIELTTGEPLVRTKDLGTPGEQGVLKAHAEFDLGKGAYVNCFRQALNAAGLDFNVPNNGPIAKSSVLWEMYDDPAGAENNPTEFYVIDASQTGNAVQSDTDENGDAKMGLEGLGQRYILPPDPPPYIRTVWIRATVQLKKNDFYNNMTDAISTALSGMAMPASIVSALVEHAHAFGVTQSFRVKDWLKDFKVETTVDYSSGGDGPEYPFLSGIKCDGLAGQWDLSGVTFTLDKDGNGTAQGALGPVKVSYVPGDPAKLKFDSDGVRQSVTVIPGNFCKK